MDNGDVFVSLMEVIEGDLETLYRSVLDGSVARYACDWSGEQSYEMAFRAERTSRSVLDDKDFIGRVREWGEEQRSIGATATGIVLIAGEASALAGTEDEALRAASTEMVKQKESSDLRLAMVITIDTGDVYLLAYCDVTRVPGGHMLLGNKWVVCPLNRETADKGVMFCATADVKDVAVVMRTAVCCGNGPVSSN